MKNSLRVCVLVAVSFALLFALKTSPGSQSNQTAAPVVVRATVDRSAPGGAVSQRTAQRTVAAGNERRMHDALKVLAPAPPAAVAKAAAQEAYARLPLQFEENRGQTDARVKYLARGRGYIFFLTPEESVLAFRSAAREQAGDTVVRFALGGANAAPRIEGAERLEAISNYFIGSDPAKWRTEIPNYAKVVERNIYPGIDATYYGKDGRLESDFIVMPGHDPTAIRLKIGGARKVEVSSGGDLVLTTSGGKVTLEKPVLYQMVKGARHEVVGGFRLLAENEAGFAAGEYDHSLPLVIDPTIVYSTYLGGSGNSGDVAFGIAVDSAGAAYVTGQAQSPDFPTQNPVQGAPGAMGATNAFITRFAASGASLVYSTYVGGSAFDQARSIAIDAAGEAYITGNTSSPDFPRVPPSGPGPNGGEDAFVTKIAANGSALTFSQYLGGESTDFGNAIAVDSAGNAYVTGETQSMTFPVTAGTFQQTLNGGENAFVTKLSSAGARTWSTYLGGEGFDGGNGIAVDGSGNVYLTGFTTSMAFPVAAPIQANLGAAGAQNAFITEMNSAGTMLVYSTYLGGMFTDTGLGIALDSGGNTVVVGTSGSPDFPTLGSLQGHDPQSDLFVAKIKPGGASLVFSTLFGDASGRTDASAVALDSADNIYVTGQTNALFFPTLNPLQATTQAGTFGEGFEDTGTAFVVEFKSDGSDYFFSTFFGGAQDLNPNEGYVDGGNGIAVDSGGNIYLAGISETVDFPTVNPFQPALLSTFSNGFVAKISPATPAGPQVFPAQLNLGTVPVGSQSGPQLITIANGTGTLNFTSFTFAGTDPGDFAETDSCGPTLVPHVVCTVAITATPGAMGTRSAMLQINDSDPSSPQTISLTVTGGTQGPPPQTGTLSFTPNTSLPAFGPQEVSTTSSVQSISVMNTGSVTVDFNWQSGGTDPQDFNPFNGTCIGTLATGTSCTIGVNFQPTATGSRMATVDITGNFTGSPVSIGVSGTGTPNQIMVAPQFISFPNTVIMTTSAPQPVTITNTSSTLPLTSISIQAPAAPFAIATNTCGATLPPNGNCSLGITFSPTVAGQEAESIIRVTSSDPVNMISVFFGVGLNPAATLAPINPNTLPFPRQAIGTTSPAQDLFLQNFGNTALVFTASVAGTNPTDFTESDFCGSTIPAGGNCLVSITFTPGALGGRSALLTFNSTTVGVTGVPQAVTLTGTGVSATTAAVAPTSLLFPNTPVSSTSAPQLVTFSNTGNRQLAITSAAIGGTNPGDFQFTFVSNGPATIGCSGGFPGAVYNPDVACPISFTFTPTGAGLRTATFTIMDSASNSPQIVMLQGNSGSGPAVMLTPPSVAFGTVTQGQTSSPMTVTLTNTGNLPLMFTAAPALSGTNAGDFAIDPTSTCVVATPVAATGGTCTVVLKFTPSTSGTTENATLTFADNATPATQTVPITGIGSSAPTPAVTFSPASVAFGAVNVGTPATPIPVTLTNSGTAALSIAAITLTGANAADFMQTNNCPVNGLPLPPMGTCMITVSFTPSAAGNESAVIQVADNASGSPQMLSLTGTGASTAAGFTFTATSATGGNGSTASILPGDTAVFTLVLQPNPGFIGPINIACASTIPATIATANPTMINVTTSPSPSFNIMCTLQTNCVPSLVGPGERRPPQGPWGGDPSAPIGAVGGVALLMALLLRRAPRPWAARLAPVLLLLLLVMTWTACVHNDPPILPGAPTTPAGVYQIQVIATAPGGVKQSVSLTVHVI